MSEIVDRCLLCGSDLEPVIDLGVQAFTGVFPRVHDPVPEGPLEIVRCLGPCGLVQLNRIYPSSVLYGDSYGYRSGLNASMVRHLSDVAEDALSRVDLKDGDTILDIGSNDGTLLSEFQARTSRRLRLVGVDPTVAQFREHYPEGILAFPDFFSADLWQSIAGRGKARVVTSIAMFYDLADPLSFASEVASILAPDGVWIMEQSYLPTMLEQVAYDTICHEHLEYYGLRQIDYIARRVGLQVVDVSFDATNGGSFRVVLAHGGTRTERVQQAIDSESGLGSTVYDRFRRRVESHRDELRSWLDERRSEGSLVGGYGASTKGNVLLQYCGVTREDLPWIAEVNERKFGRVTPGTRIPIIPEEEAHGYAPDYLLVFPWHFREFVVVKESGYMEAGGTLVFPLPRLSCCRRIPHSRDRDLTRPDRATGVAV